MHFFWHILTSAKAATGQKGAWPTCSTRRDAAWGGPGSGPKGTVCPRKNRCNALGHLGPFGGRNLQNSTCRVADFGLQDASGLTAVLGLLLCLVQYLARSIELAPPRTTILEDTNGHNTKPTAAMSHPVKPTMSANSIVMSSASFPQPPVSTC